MAPLVDNVFEALEKHGQLAITGPSGPVQGVSHPSNGKWKLKPEIQKVNDVEIYSPGLFQIDDESSVEQTITSLSEQQEPWGVPHTTFYKFRNEQEFDQLVQKGLKPISICTYGGEYWNYFNATENNSVWSVNCEGFNTVLGVAARPQDGELFRERGYGVAPCVSQLNGCEFKLTRHYISQYESEAFNIFIEKHSHIKTLYQTLEDN